MKKVYFLQTCNTCRKLLKELSLDHFEKQEIKSNPITISQLEEMHTYSDSYEMLFNKRAKKYTLLDLENRPFSEEGFKQLILGEYTFLKRPVFIIDHQIFIGNSKKEIEKLKQKLASLSALK